MRVPSPLGVSVVGVPLPIEAGVLGGALCRNFILGL